MLSNGSNKNSRKGSILLFIIVIGALLVAGAAFMFGSVQVGLASNNREYQRIHAENAATSVLNKTIQKFKTGSVDFADAVAYSRDDATASVTFDDQSTGPYSTNNFLSSSATSGWNNQMVPARSAHLVCVAENGGQRIVKEMVISMDAFPWSVASNGTIQGNDMEVYAVPSVEAAADGVTDNEKSKSHILSNGAGGTSIALSGNTVVSGDAKAVGDIDLVGGARIEGEELENQAVTGITINKSPADYDPVAVGKPALTFGSSTPEVAGRYIHNGDVTIRDLTFNDGLLFVRGDVEVTGEISGEGALVATGDITVTGKMKTKADLAALVSGGDVVINGTGQSSSSFQGLILAEGSFRAKDTTVIGSVISKAAGGSVELERVTMVRAKDLSAMDITYDVELKNFTQGQWSGNTRIGVLYKGQFVPNDDENYTRLQLLAQEIAKDGGKGQVVFEVSTGNYSTTPPLTLQNDFTLADGSWTAYEGQVKSSTIVTEEIFQLDFNKFLKVKGSFRPLYQKLSTL